MLKFLTTLAFFAQFAIAQFALLMTARSACIVVQLRYINVSHIIYDNIIVPSFECLTSGNKATLDE